MRLPPTVVLLVLATPIGVGVGALLLGRRIRSTGATFLKAFGWVALWALPAVVVQYATQGASDPAAWGEALAWAPLPWWVLLGGVGVQRVFEATVSGRSDTFFSHGEVYLAYAALLAVALAAVVAWRWRRGVRLSDPVVLLVGALVLANALLGVRWPWWGT